MEATVHETISKVKVPLFEARTPNNVLDERFGQAINYKQKRRRIKLGNTRVIKVGSVESPNNNAGKLGINFIMLLNFVDKNFDKRNIYLIRLSIQLV